ncbi:MAG TPA: sensor domain-containing diguanylate cyclase [Solirubrobacteraceae bacterium]|nr:sensor domain-containing diguanylate cyclase [Solirubrobacteraceae bacterium]
MRRLTLLADRAADTEAIFLALAGELLGTLGAEEVHVHHLADSGSEDELVVLYMYDGSGRLSYLTPRGERAPGVSWVASTGRSFVAANTRELAASVPRVVATGPASSALLVPLTVRGEPEAVVVLVRRSSGAFSEHADEQAATLVDQAATALALLRARAEAGTDAVTGSMNHRAMRRRLHEEIGRAHRGDSPLACLLIDLDDFKEINDRYGHPAGDAALRAVAQALMGEFRAFDRVARYGGDEFVVILPNADLDSAAAAAERASQRLRDLRPVNSSQGIRASIGVAQWLAPMTVDALLQACDTALLQSKRNGKGRVTRVA